MKTEIKFVSLNDGPGVEWPHFEWRVTINSVGFEYKTGLGHRTDFFQGVRRMGQGEYGHGYKMNKRPTGAVTLESAKCWAHTPKIDDVLECLVSDMDAGDQSFHDFCDNFGYDRDSIKALDTYRACMESGEKLRRALGGEYQATVASVRERQESA